MACSSLCSVGILAQKMKEPVSLPVCEHSSSDLLTKGSGGRDHSLAVVLVTSPVHD